jgi:ubiquinone/menaquinone biosynthesis C-methylase UbiE
MHEGLLRLGQGNAQSTLKALSYCHALPSAPRILDVGCGTGSQTLILAAELSDARITATDLVPIFLTQLKTQADRRGWLDHIEVKEADMNALPFPENSFELIWSEGAVYIMGFFQGLKKWRPLVRPGGYLVVSEISWFRSDPPAELRDYWQEQYPGIRHVVPPQNLVDRTIVDVSALGVKLAYPDASLAVRPARNRPIETPAAARARARESRLATAAGHPTAQDKTPQADEG